MPDDRSIRCVGAVVHDAAGRLLLVRRANEPGRGRWSLPGGRVERGESDEQAVARELAEETGITVSVGRHVGSVTRSAPDGAIFDIHDYACRFAGGALRAGDDADDARWCDAATLATLPLVAGLINALTAWDCLPR
ncbi:MAG: NUDIX domain-containing protein [Pseudonocardiaceae bacterium]|nr:NUDIX domain-containing protein [Pseudonocardiaceae bacterium]